MLHVSGADLDRVESLRHRIFHAINDFSDDDPPNGEEVILALVRLLVFYLSAFDADCRRYIGLELQRQWPDALRTADEIAELRAD